MPRQRISPTEYLDPDVELARLIEDTPWYHGGSYGGGVINPSRGTPGNLYGMGFYSTEDIGIARSYADFASESGKPANVYEGQARGIRKAINLEDPVHPAIQRSIKNISPGFQVNPRQRGTEVLQQFFRHGRQRAKDMAAQGRNSGSYHREVRNLEKGLATELRGQGYDALTHLGGASNEGPRHAVAIFLDPHAQYASGPAEQLQLTLKERGAATRQARMARGVVTDSDRMARVQSKRKMTPTNALKSKDATYSRRVAGGFGRVIKNLGKVR